MNRRRLRAGEVRAPPPTGSLAPVRGRLPDEDALKLEQPTFQIDASGGGETAQATVRAENAVAGDDQRHPIRRQALPNRSGGFG